uniref:Uncharacterized protein n=1 Tax=Helicotheca tamesis TaxID=374047 RepID=A0A7S2IBV1_9STRA
MAVSVREHNTEQSRYVFTRTATEQTAEERAQTVRKVVSRGSDRATKMRYRTEFDANPIDSSTVHHVLDSPREFHASLLQIERERRGALRQGRILEDVNYWRQRAGWADDDTTMQEFNQGVYDSYYAMDDVFLSSNANADGSTGKAGGIMKLAKFVGLILGVLLVYLLVRAVRRSISGSSSGSSSGSKKSKSSSSGSGSRSTSRRRSSSRARATSLGRSRSKSVGRTRSSRSRSRSRRAKSSSDDDYALMEDDQRPRKSGRSRSRTVRRSRSRARSKNRESSAPKENMLV